MFLIAVVKKFKQFMIYWSVNQQLKVQPGRLAIFNSIEGTKAMTSVYRERCTFGTHATRPLLDVCDTLHSDCIQSQCAAIVSVIFKMWIVMRSGHLLWPTKFIYI